MEFRRESVRHELAMRRLTVSAVRPVAPSIVRVTLVGDDLSGFASLGPTDHVKLFLPDPATGVLTTPSFGSEGVIRPTDGVILSRDYTPRAFRPDARGAELDIDFVVHGDEGPATAFAARAAVGDELGIAGPRGSRLVPDGIRRLIVVADETAFPATARWLELLPADVQVTALFDAADETVIGYFDDVHGGDRLDAEWLFREDGPGQLDEALRSLGPVEDDTYVFLAGEATALTPLRRYLRHELGLPKEQVAASGYWRRGVVNLDHHAPLDPSDPD